MRRLARALVAVGLVALAVGWFLTRPQDADLTGLETLSGDPAQGAWVFDAAGCASCHSAPEAEGDALRVLSGGRGFPSPFGTFYAPNISPSPDHGIGGWTVADLANAMLAGISPDGAHYYPAFPYISYSNARLQDIADLHAFMMTLPVSEQPNRSHDVGFPFSIRRGLGLWKLLNAGKGWVIEQPATDQIDQGRYLVEALGHCAECHTPRNALGGLDRDRWMQGGPVPVGKGSFPPLVPSQLKWTAGDIAYYLETGFTPDFDSAGGTMVEVIQNTSRLPPEDRAAIAAYLKALPDGSANE
ncbi:MAG: cytochrome c [Ruegeria sp.]